METSRTAELEECFSERFTGCSDDFDHDNRKLEIHLSGGNFQRELYKKKLLP